jgi:hypothetical protein
MEICATDEGLGEEKRGGEKFRTLKKMELNTAGIAALGKDGN